MTQAGVIATLPATTEPPVWPPVRHRNTAAAVAAIVTVGSDASL